MINASKKNSESGFVLPMALVLTLVLTISGMGFGQLNHVENLLVMQEVDNQSAFYLANAGIERARATFKIPNDLTWTTVLDGSDPNYPTDTTASSDLCPYYDSADPLNNRGCVIPPFQTTAKNSGFIISDGDAVAAPDFPFFAGVFDQGIYTVRAFNNVDDPGVGVDTDQRITLRAMGRVRGEEKIIEVDVVATSGMKLINCEGEENDVCPDSQNDNTQIIHLPDREPATTPDLPPWNEAHYRDINNLACSSEVKVIGNMDLVDAPNPTKPWEVQLQSDRCYFATGNIDVKSNATYQNVVVFSDQDLLVSGNTQFSQNTVLVGLNEVQLQGNITTHAPLLQPAIISKGDIVKGNASVQIYGNIYTEGSVGDAQHPWNPNQIEGIIVGSDVFLKAAATLITDGGKVQYYQFMDGFEYSDDLKGTAIVSKSWKEIK